MQKAPSASKEKGIKSEYSVRTKEVPAQYPRVYRIITAGCCFLSRPDVS